MARHFLRYMRCKMLLLSLRGRVLFLCMFGGLCALTCQSCCTTALWDSLDPGERVWIPADQITEEELKSKGLEYEKYDITPDKLKQEVSTYKGDSRGVQGYLVEKGGLRKLRDCALLVAATPITLVVDGVVVAVVVAGCILPEGTYFPL
jgi:hypothetical protein